MNQDDLLQGYEAMEKEELRQRTAETLERIRIEHGLPRPEEDNNPISEKDPNKIESPLAYDLETDTERDAWFRGSLKKQFKESKHKEVATNEIAKYLTGRYNIKTLGSRDRTREIYIYEEGIYKQGTNLIKKEVQEILQELATIRHKNEVIETIKDMTWMDRKSFTVSKNLINLENGILDIEKKELIQHDSKYLFFSKIPVEYIPGSDCPAIKKFLSEIQDEDSTNVLQEWFGYTLHRSYFLKKAIIFLGNKDTGKTTLLRVLENFLGKDNVSGVSLQKISSDRFSLSNLNNKHANIYDDLSFKDINDNGTFKMLTGGGTVTGEFKFGDQFQFENYAKLTFSCNKIPTVTDTDDDAYFSRWIVIKFEEKIEKLDKFLTSKLTTKEEMSGLLNFALEGMYRLLEKQDFSYDRTPEQIKIEMSLSASPVAQFVLSQLEMVSDPNVFITKDQMQQEFINYAKANNLPVVSKETLGKKLPKFIKVSDGSKSLYSEDTKTKKQTACWIGVKFKNPIKESEATASPEKGSLESLFENVPPG